MYSYVRNNPLKNTDPNGKDCQNGVAACANYFAGAFGAVVNAFSSGLINAPNHIANAVISLTGSDFRFPDAVQPAFTPANEEQQQGQQAANAVMLVAPVAEAGATALVEAVGTGTRVEAAAAAATDVPTSIPAGPTARPTAAQQAAINEMGDAHGCNTCGTSNPGTQSGNWVGDITSDCPKSTRRRTGLSASVSSVQSSTRWTGCRCGKGRKEGSMHHRLKRDDDLSVEGCSIVVDRSF